ncbi:hypothetical protein ST47_g7858 [Ascochyta rabiei]|uniref:Uncharacterized protein n=1 Tax=Didymella rabiei TaxID=5454 RepID=A0A163A5C9_DIDRA|nr:hypothetical protein ST47_g7858 [Ascochyta rabiei]
MAMESAPIMAIPDEEVEVAVELAIDIAPVVVGDISIVIDISMFNTGRRCRLVNSALYERQKMGLVPTYVEPLFKKSEYSSSEATVEICDDTSGNNRPK